MDDTRPDPDALIAAAAREGRGRLKVFLGAAPGVGKTWEMLAQARRRQAEGVDVLAGVIETHGRAETEAQTRRAARAAAEGGRLPRPDAAGVRPRCRPGPAPRPAAGGRAGPHQRPRQPPRQAVGGRAGAGGRRAARLGDAQRAAPGKPERRRRPHHRRARRRDPARPGAGGRGRDRADRRAAGRAARAPGQRPHLPRRYRHARAGGLLQGGQPCGAAGDRAAPGGGARGWGRARLDAPSRRVRPLAGQRPGAGAGRPGCVGGGRGAPCQAPGRRLARSLDGAACRAGDGRPGQPAFAGTGAGAGRRGRDAVRRRPGRHGAGGGAGAQRDAHRDRPGTPAVVAPVAGTAR